MKLQEHVKVHFYSCEGAGDDVCAGEGVGAGVGVGEDVGMCEGAGDNTPTQCRCR